MLSNFTPGGDATIAVSNFRTGGSNVVGTRAYIVAQRGSRSFKVHLNDSSEAVMQLVTAGTLSVNQTFNVQVILDDSTVSYVEKFYNNTIHYVTAGGTTGHVPYSLLNVEADDEGKVTGKGNIDIRKFKADGSQF